jgi:hypothetical protein
MQYPGTHISAYHELDMIVQYGYAVGPAAVGAFINGKHSYSVILPFVDLNSFYQLPQG